ncbi:MAG TPA: hypothetical protein VGR57_03615 [Ktedonobacterales bacterium]|nr:hypothetical protein [Ktedonobacterales bacterium]
MPGDKAQTTTAARVGAFLRALAERAERDAAFAEGVAEALTASGLLPAPRTRRASSGPDAPAGKPAAIPTTDLDPFATLRGAGEAGLRAALGAIELPALHQIVRTYRLDPARISARWSARERLIELIVTQVRARASHGQAFARV